jgi:hypothetical protein
VVKIAFDAEVSVAAHFAHEALRRAVAALSGRSERGELSLAAAVGPSDQDVARIEVPVLLEIVAGSSDPASPLKVSVRARSAAAAFPEFRGSIEVSEIDAAQTRVTLSGSYTVPLGVVGAAVNAVALDRIARQSLQRLFDLLVGETNAIIIRQEEEEYRAARQRGA